MEPRSQEEIDKEYAELCTKYGDLSQKKLHIETEKVKVLKNFNEQITEYEGQIETHLVEIDRELSKIRKRWKELQIEVQGRVPQSNG